MTKALEGMFEQGFVVFRVLGIAPQRPDQLVIFYEPRSDSRGHDYADSSAHVSLPSVRSPGKPVDAVERGGFIALSKGGVIEHRINEVVQCPAEGHDRLPNVQQLTGALANNMHSK